VASGGSRPMLASRVTTMGYRLVVSAVEHIPASRH
jgi:hypothetical protein